MTTNKATWAATVAGKWSATVAQLVELLSCAGSCGISCTGSRSTGVPLFTSLVPSCAPLFTSLVPPFAPLLASLVPFFAPLLTPLHAKCLRLSVRYGQHRGGRRETERSRQSHK